MYILKKLCRLRVVVLACGYIVLVSGHILNRLSAKINCVCAKCDEYKNMGTQTIILIVLLTLSSHIPVCP